jgi:hypothetical protein
MIIRLKNPASGGHQYLALLAFALSNPEIPSISIEKPTMPDTLHRA